MRFSPTNCSLNGGNWSKPEGATHRSWLWFGILDTPIATNPNKSTGKECPSLKLTAIAQKERKCHLPSMDFQHQTLGSAEPSTSKHSTRSILLKPHRINKFLVTYFFPQHRFSLAQNKRILGSYFKCNRGERGLHPREYRVNFKIFGFHGNPTEKLGGIQLEKNTSSPRVSGWVRDRNDDCCKLVYL